MSNNYRVSSLLSKTIDYIIDNLSVYIKHDSIVIKNLPPHIKDRMLRRFTTSSYFWRNLNFTCTLSVLLHSRTRHIDLSCVTLDNEILEALKPCQNLEEVYLTRRGTHSVTSQGLINFFTNKPKICMLTIAKCVAINDDVVEAIAENCHNLAGLDLDGCENISDKSLESLAAMKNLKWLILSNTKVSNSGIKLLVEGKSANNITELRIANCPNITYSILETIADNCPNIEVLEFHNTSSLTDETMFSNIHENTLKHLKQLTWTVTW